MMNKAIYFQTMNRLFLLFLVFAFGLTAVAQQAKEEIEQNPNLSASNYLAYPAPTGKMTPAPKGYKPFYISHYGRHGSRYLIDENDYNYPLQALGDAERQNRLTEMGKDVLRRLKLLREESRGRTGELTELGAEQHKQIAQRMYERFPEVFKGDVCIDAKSTVVIRCILSMENELQQFLLLNPKLRIRHDASYHDMYYMNQQDTELYKKKMPQRAKVTYEKFCKDYKDYSDVMGRLFNDADYIRYEVDAEKLGYVLFKLAGNLQSSELRKKITLYDLFTKDELHKYWLQTNAWWYINYGPSPLNGGTQPFSQRNLLQNIIHQADSCIALPHPGATLRFGHETMVMPLACLLGLNGYDRQIKDLDKLEQEGWVNYRIFPMGANIQFIFFRKKQGGDVLLKVLLNENEATLPIKTDMAPYYRWEDFKAYYNNKLAGYSSSEKL